METVETKKRNGDVVFTRISGGAAIDFPKSELWICYEVSAQRKTARRIKVHTWGDIDGVRQAGKDRVSDLNRTIARAKQILDAALNLNYQDDVEIRPVRVYMASLHKEKDATIKEIITGNDKVLYLWHLNKKEVRDYHEVTL